MPEKTKQDDSSEICADKVSEKLSDREINFDDGNWSDDQKKKRYYYDDAYGYEVYNPDADDEDAENR